MKASVIVAGGKSFSGRVPKGSGSLVEACAALESPAWFDEYPVVRSVGQSVSVSH